MEGVRLRTLALLGLVAASSLAPGPGEAAAVTGLLWRKSAGLALPLPQTHSEWLDHVQQVSTDASGRLHGLWRLEPGPSYAYRWSSDGVAWSAPEPVQGAQHVLRASASGEVHVTDSRLLYSHRSTAGQWTSERIGTGQDPLLEVDPDGRVWVVYSTVDRYTSPRPLYARSRNPSTGVWGTVETISSNIYPSSIVDLLITGDGTPWVLADITAIDPHKVRVFHRTPTGWIAEEAAGDSNGGVALSEDGSGRVVLLYWAPGLGADPGLVLAWARREGSGSWSRIGTVRDRSVIAFDLPSVVVAQRAADGTIVAAWNECRGDFPGRCYQLASRLAPAASQWTAASLVGRFPRGGKSLSLTLLPNGRGYLAGFYRRLGWVAREQTLGAWSDHLAPAEADQVTGPPDSYGVEAAAGPDDSLYAVWTQETGDGLGSSDVGRTPHVVFAVRSRAGVWSAPQAVDVETPWRPYEPASNSYNVEPDILGIATAPAGDGYVIWRDYQPVVRADEVTVVEVLRGRHRRPDGAWDPVEELPFIWGLALDENLRIQESRPEMVFDSQGVLWLLNAFGEGWSRSPTGTWSAQPSVLPQTVTAFFPRFAVAPDGRQYAAWHQSAGQDTGIYLSRREKSASWSPPERVNGTTGALVDRRIGGLAAVGTELVVAWSEYADSDPDRNVWAAFANTLNTSTGQWSGPRRLAHTRNLRITDVHAMLDGRIFTIWARCSLWPDNKVYCPGDRLSDESRLEGKDIYASAVEGAMRGTDGAWSAAMFVSGLRETNFDQWRDLPRLVGFRDPTTAWWDPIPFTYIFGIPFYDYQPRLGSPSSSAAVGFSDARVEMILPPTSPQAGETAQVQVTMQEPDGTPLAERVIAWQVSGVGSFVSVQGATDAGGRAIAQVTSQKSGTMTATVTTSHGLVKASGSIQWLPGPPSALRMSPASSSGTAGSPVSVKAVLTDAYGNGIPGASIDWAIESGPGSIVSAQPQTDASGTATAIVRSTTVGTTRLRAAVLGTSFQATASIFWQPGPPTKLTLEPTASTLRAGTLGALTAQVTDAYGNAAPVPRLLIRWEWSGTGVLAGFEPLTDADGRARAQPLSLTAGTQRVTAILHSTGARAEATVQWT